MRNVIIKVHPSKIRLKKQNQLAWKIAEVASDKAPLTERAIEMVMFFLFALFRLENYRLFF